jgi:hypothetical protein
VGVFLIHELRMRLSSRRASGLLDTNVRRYAPTVALIKGHHYTRIQCRHCGHAVKHYGDGNALVGCHERMRCSVCGKRGADLHRVYTQDPPPRASVVPIR